jgi:pyruvate-formate lyase
LNQIEIIAIAAHETIKKFCDENGETTNLHWNECPEWQKHAAIANVKFVLETDNVTDEMLHDFWMKDKLEHGWKLGDVKDTELKIHPCLVPFEEISEYQQMKDRLFINTVQLLDSKSYDYN